MPDATTWLRRVSQNPEKYGTTRTHVKNIDSDIRRMVKEEEKERIKMEKRNKKEGE